MQLTCTPQIGPSEVLYLDGFREHFKDLKSYVWEWYNNWRLVNIRMDKISKEERSRNMANIRSRNTKPELLLRKELFSRGLRYRIHYRIDKISVDIAFPSKKRAVNVHGCFWHQHQNCSEASTPKTNSEYWKSKLEKNMVRDKRNIKELKEMGWEVLAVWECELEKSTDHTVAKVVDFIENNVGI